MTVNALLKPILRTILLPSLAVLMAEGAQECKVRGLSLQSGTPAAEAHAFDEAVATALGKVQIKTFLNHESDVLKLKGTKLAFSAQPELAGARDPGVFIGTCRIPAKSKSVILLFVPEEPGKPASRILAIDDGAKSFPPGSTMVFNLTSTPIKVVLEKKEYTFTAGESRAITDQPVNDNHSSGMVASFEKDGTWETFSTGVWSHPGEKRVLQVITENPASKQVEIRGIRDVSSP